KGVQLVASVNPTATPIMAEARRLQQVLTNLVNNAIKFTPAGGRVDVRIQRVGGDVQFTVKDNGQGISPDFLPHVFERFRQQDSTTTRSAFGLGLGLAIAKHLVELHGGTITAASDGVGCGATFVVRLPAAVGAAVATSQRSTGLA
ncbi:MAG: ATP-binding protein, partial [Acidobacteria bacterium]|nr:ATP-binding protein [Acidobacteriota bacterium]